jgi:hypothetical protein
MVDAGSIPPGIIDKATDFAIGQPNEVDAKEPIVRPTAKG